MFGSREYAKLKTMLELLFIHVSVAVLLILAITYRFAALLLFAKKTDFLQTPIVGLTVLQVATGFGLMFSGVPLARVCIPGIALITVVFVSQILLKRLSKSIVKI